MSRYYFEIESGGRYPIYDRQLPHVGRRPHCVGTLHDVIVAERVVHLLNDYEDRHHEGR